MLTSFGNVLYSLWWSDSAPREGYKMQKLDLYIGGGDNSVDRGALEAVATPPDTDSWFALPHHRLLDQVDRTLQSSGLKIVAERHVLAREGQRYFGLLQVSDGSEKDYSLVIGLRNSHDKSIVAGLAVGSGVHVCSNLAFSSEIVIERKHTRFAGRDLPALVESAVGRLGDLRRSQGERIDAYKRAELTDAQAHDLIIRANDARVVPVTRIPDILTEWRTPRHLEFAQQGKTAWRLFNAFTETLKDSSLFKRPVATQALHGLMDTVCGLN